MKIYDWKSYFHTYFRKIPNITKYHHFVFKSSSPGITFVKEFPSTEEKTVKMVKNRSNFEGFPDVLTPKGLTAERSWYLYKHIREHVSDDCKDITCPKPSVAMPKSSDILKQGRIKDDD